MKVAVLYARVSSKEQEKEGFSIPAQQKLLQKYAADNALKLAAEFLDVETAKEAGRANFNAMVRYLQDHPDAKIILVEKTDRLYRNFKDYVTVDGLDVEIHLVKEGEILSAESRSHQKFIHGIRVLMAKNYIDNLSEEVRKGQTEKAAQGEWPSRAPVGYRNNKETHRLEADPQKGPFIRKLFELYATGSYSLQQLVLTARSSGLFSSNSQTINKAGIHRILRNPIYHGEFEWKGSRYQGTHEPIISQELFESVQRVFAMANRPRQTKRRLPFAGLLQCNQCGCAMTPEIKKGKYVYYHCTQYRGRCSNDYVREESLAQQLGEIVRRIQIDEATAESIREALRSSHKEKIAFHETAIAALQVRQKRFQSLLDRAYEDRLLGNVAEDVWLRKSAEWQRELQEVESQIGRHHKADLNYVQTGHQILELAKTAHSMYLNQSRQEQRKLLDILLSNCSYDRGNLYPTYNKPFDVLAEGHRFESMRGRRDSNSRPPA